VADAGRVIAGRARGLRLVAPGGATRPLGDRVKQTLFAILEPRLDGAAVIDLFAGSGAGGIEAASRGAASVVFVERDAAAVEAIRANLRRTRLDGPTMRIVRGEVLAWLAGAGGFAGPFDIALLDPPYDEPALLEGALGRLADPAAKLLSAAAVVVAKHFWRDRPPARIGLLASMDERRFGETALTFYRRDDGAGEAA
jgi:16S rRNA (guanine(966)-N(2))-methyltransferase RsmD